METVSEKRKRGRPPAFDHSLLLPHERALWEAYMPRGTKRTRLNWNYMLAGNGVIRANDKDDPRYKWISDGEKMRYAVLVELGRIAKAFNDATAVAWADHLTAEVAAGRITTTRQAAAYLRNARLSHLGKPSKPSATALQELITTTIITTYLQAHPDATAALVQEALRGAYGFSERLAEA